MEAVRFHGNLMNGDASKNKQQQKDDMRHNMRTNKSKAGYLRQLVRHARSAGAMLRRNKAEGASAAAARATTIDRGGVDRESVSDGFEAKDEGHNAPLVNANSQPVNAMTSTCPVNSIGNPSPAPLLRSGTAPAFVVT